MEDSTMFSLFKPKLVAMFKDENFKTMTLRLDKDNEPVIDKYNVDLVEYVSGVKTVIDESKALIVQQQETNKNLQTIIDEKNAEIENLNGKSERYKFQLKEAKATIKELESKKKK